jgi:pimeloyl-ACP methyl ester carboxylesterase
MPIRIKPSRRRDAKIIGLILGVLGVLAVQSYAADPSKPFLLHLPGIGGHMLIDDRMTAGLIEGGLDVELEIYDWTDNDSGLPALGNYNRNQLQAARIAERLTAVYRADPKRRIILTSHSGGGGVAVWALEKLPDNVKIDTLLLLAPALSPKYDLSRALKHVTGKAYSFTSTLDPINTWGTKGFGTIDRVQTEAAGSVGFQTPAGADLVQYDKLIGFPYDAAWVRLGNDGDHIGTMSRTFGRVMLAPLLLTGKLPYIAPATQPATRPLVPSPGTPEEG